MSTATPTTPSERIADIDVLRGVALFGVLVINFVTIFRVSLFLQIETFHTEPGALNAAVDWILGMVVESKAFGIFSFLFGVSLAIFRGRAGPLRLVRRLAILLAIGLVHLVFVWNGDILTPYAVAGLLALPLLGRRVAIGIAVAIGVLYCLPLPVPDPLPHGRAAFDHAADAVRIYGGGSWLEILAFRTSETRRFVLPLLGLTLPRIIALILVGDFAWRRGLLRDPDAHRPLLRAVTALGLAVGGAATALGA